MSITNDEVVALIEDCYTEGDLRAQEREKRAEAKRLLEEADKLSDQAHALGITTDVVNGIAIRVDPSWTIYGDPGNVEVRPTDWGIQRWANAWLNAHDPKSQKWRWEARVTGKSSYRCSGWMSYDQVVAEMIDYVTTGKVSY